MIKLAMVQFAPSSDSSIALEHNLHTHLAAMQQAQSLGVSLLVFPELSLTGYELAEAARLALSPQHPMLFHLQAQVDDLGVSVVVGAPWYATENMNDRPQIASILLRPHLAPQVYAKMHLHAGEQAYISAGSDYLLFTHHGLRIGMAICADTLHDSHAQHYADLQADVYVAAVLISEQGYAADAAQLQAHAQKHGMVVAMANFSGRSGDWLAAGKSCVWSPTAAIMGVAAASTALELRQQDFQLLIAAYEHGEWQASLYPA